MSWLDSISNLITGNDDYVSYPDDYDIYESSDDPLVGEVDPANLEDYDDPHYNDEADWYDNHPEDDWGDD